MRHMNLPASCLYASRCAEPQGLSGRNGPHICSEFGNTAGPRASVTPRRRAVSRRRTPRTEECTFLMCLDPPAAIAFSVLHTVVFVSDCFDGRQFMSGDPAQY